MKKLKIIGSIICFFFYTTAFLSAVNFKTQSDVDNTENWAAISASNPAIFYENFSLSTSIVLQSSSSLSSDDYNTTRTLTASNENSFFSLTENSQNTSLNINKIVLKGGIYKGSSLNGGAAIRIPGMNFTLNGKASFIQNSSRTGAGGAIFLSSGTLTFTDNVVFKENSALSGAGAVYCASGSVKFESYVIAENNESSLGGVVRANGIVLNDGGYFIGNKANSGGALYLVGGFSNIRAITKDVLFSGNTMKRELDGTYLRNDIYMESGSNLTFDVAKARTITLDGGIVCNASNNIVTKIGQGVLIFNGDFYIQNLNVYDGTLRFGAGSTFFGESVNFSSSAFINMVTRSSNELKFEKLNSAASLYYDVDLNSRYVDLIIVNTSALMNGTRVKISLSGVNSSSLKYNIIIASGVVGGNGYITFDNTNAQGSRMTRVHGDIDYGSGGNTNHWNEVNLNIQVDQLSNISGLSGNERTTAFALDSDYGQSLGDFFYIIDTIDKMSTPRSMISRYDNNTLSKKDALNSLSGYIYANAITVPALNDVRNNIFSRLERSYFPNDDTLSKRNIWGHCYSANDLYEGNNDSPGDFKSTRNGIQVGFDTLKDDAHIFGITAGSIDSNCIENDDKVDITGYNVGCYGSYFLDNNLEIRALLAGSREKYTSSRSIKYLNRETNAQFEGYSVNIAAELAYSFYYRDKLCLRPFVGVDYDYVHIDDFIEKGADAANLSVFDNSYNKAGPVFGFQINNGVNAKFKWQIELKIDLLLYGRYGEITQKMKNGRQSMTIKGIENDIFNANVDAGIIYDITKSFGIYANINTSILGADILRGFYCNVGTNFKFNDLKKDFYEETSKLTE
ncbi:MAG: autotransporter outer membrane beta-barrel domain-containing protein [Endomicrobium sp.]|jgi:outer membrane autotransporter protein|nr:autotransporter outer membrane beta-barrel domain-containing protein [Endomicrobium sp.]